MSEHKFKVGDPVRTKPMKVIQIEGPYVISGEIAGDRIMLRAEYLELETIPATDAEVVEKCSRAIALKHYEKRFKGMPDAVSANVEGNWQIFADDVQTTITALTSSGYTRSPKPDVNQMMLEALKIGQSWLERWAEHVGNCRAGSECTCGLTRIRYDLSAAIAAGSGE